MHARTIRILGTAFLVLALGACGGGNDAAPDPGPGGGVLVTVTPETSVVAPGTSRTFTASVSGASDATVTWTVDGIPGGNSTVGRVAGSGNTVTYTAPAAEDTHTLAATSVEDPGKRDTATIAVRSSCAPPPASSTIFNVRDYGATPGDTTDDTGAIQDAIDRAAGTGGTVLVPAGEYRIKPTYNQTPNVGLYLRSSMTLKLEDGAVLRATASSSGRYFLLLALNVRDVVVTGGTVVGERSTHTGTDGEDQGHGLGILGSRSVVVQNLTVKSCWGDGFYVGKSTASGASSGITLCGVAADGNRRAGISIVSVSGITIQDSSFTNTRGALGECGLNVEPDNGDTAEYITISRCIFKGNAGQGLGAGSRCGSTGTLVRGVEIYDSVVSDNGTATLNIDGAAKSGIEISNCSGTILSGNRCEGNASSGILLRSCGTSTTTGANNCVVTGNTVSNNGYAGIYQEYCRNNQITSNHGSGNGRYGIRSAGCTGSTISGNDPGLPVSIAQ